ncbi:MAG: RluA family pseudouridine synthase [Bacteroidaceae bacterium]|nr:RluA family pseudouridine synthase [Bacteroidaceae bacterium]
MKIYSLDERCFPAMEQVKAYCRSRPEWQKDVTEGKTFGVLVYEGTEPPFPAQPSSVPMPQGLTFLAAFSGTLDGHTCQPGFVPPVFDIMGEDRYFIEEEAGITAINRYLESGQPSPREVCELRHERKVRSRALQRWLFSRYRVCNALGEWAELSELFAPSVPPGGAGDCCAPKLLQAAFLRGIRPLAVAEWNSSDGLFRPPCTGRCRPILAHMLKGLEAEADPRLATYNRLASALSVVYEDEWIVVVDKPSGLLSVPGKEFLPSAESLTGCLAAHRLDQDTGGLLLLARTVEVQTALRRLFEQRQVEKRYEALLEREMPVGEEGEIRLPLRPDVDCRPRQMVDMLHGKTALTKYRVLENVGGHARLSLHPYTGRTHQLRVHCAEGLGNPVLGDRLYGHCAAPRLMLQAVELSFVHPVTGVTMHFTSRFTK